MNPSVESFISVLQRSGLVDQTIVEQQFERFREESATQTAESLAQFLVRQNVVSPWQAGKLLQGKHKGFFLGRYKLISLLGKGGMSSVYLAEHVVMQRRCAIKVLPWKMVRNSSYLDRFLREARAVASLDDPNIVRAYDVDHEKNGDLEIHFLVMEYVEGRNLYDLVQREGSLPVAVAVDFIRQGALGLQHAHEAGLVHRDVKPGNFIVDRKRVVKLMDLGLARLVQDGEDRSLTIEHDERVLGTADYLAPEQAVNSHDVDARADIYGLGCTLFYLLTAQPPFQEGTLTQRLLAHQTQAPPSIRKLRPEVPADLEDILDRMLEKDREQRWQTAGDVADQLQKWLDKHSGDAVFSASAQEITTGAAEQGGAEESEEFGEAPASGSPLGDFLSSLSDSDLPFGKQPSSLKRKNAATRRPQETPRFSNLEPQMPDSNIMASGAGSGISGPVSSVLNAERARRRKQTRSVLLVVALAVVIGLVAGATLFWPGIRSGMGLASGPKVDEENVTQTSAGPNSGESNGGRSAASQQEIVLPQSKDPLRRIQGGRVDVGPGGHFATIASALNWLAANRNPRAENPVREVIIAPGTWEEPLQVPTPGLLPYSQGLRIAGASGGEVILAPPGDGPAIQLAATEGISIENLTVEGAGRPVVIDWSGRSLDTQLTGLRLRNVEQVGIAIRDVTGGDGQQRWRIADCVLFGKSESAVGIQLQSSFSNDLHDGEIANCRFLGPMTAGIRCEGPVRDLELRQNIFHDLVVAVSFSAVSTPPRQLTVRNNTFDQVGIGIDFAASFGDAQPGVTLRKNLFANIRKTEVQLGDVSPDWNRLGGQQGGSFGNWTTSSGADSTGLFSSGRMGVDVRFQSTDPANEGFLRPVNDEIRTGPNGDGLDFIGARSP